MTTMSKAIPLAKPSALGSGEAGSFAAPLGTVQDGRFTFTRGTSQTTITAGYDPKQLFEAQFSGVVPVVKTQADQVTVRYPHLPLLGWLIYHFRRPRAQIALNATIPWSLQFDGGVSHLSADLAGISLQAIALHGGISQASFLLPQPEGTVSIRLADGASGVWLKRPLGTAVRIQMTGSFDRLTIDGQHFGAAGNGLQWETESYAQASHRYSIEIVGGASHITVGTW